MKLYDHATIHLAQSIEHPAVKIYGQLMQQGVETFISNANTSIYILEYEGTYIPITMNNKEYSNSYILSNYYPAAHMQEKAVGKPVQQALAQMAGLGLKAIQINKTLILNNWFLTASPPLVLKDEQIKHITQFLIKHFPEHMISMRSLQLQDCHGYARSGYHLLPARDVFCYDATEKQQLPSRVLYHRRRDLRLLNEFEVIEQVPEEVYAYLLELYLQVYVEKHTHYSPLYSTAFLKLIVEEGLIRLLAVKKNGNYEGFFGYWIAEGKMAVPFFGYNRQAPFHQQTYCLLISLILQTADQHRVWLNDGTGGDFAKSVRGFKKQLEYAAVYTRHLSLPKRLFWACADYFMTWPTKKR